MEVRAEIVVSNPCDSSARSLRVTAVVNTSVCHMRLPQSVCDELNVEPIARRTLGPYVGVSVAFAEQRGFVGAIIAGNEVVVGWLAMQELNLIIDQRSQKLIRNRVLCSSGLRHE